MSVGGAGAAQGRLVEARGHACPSHASSLASSLDPFASLRVTKVPPTNRPLREWEAAGGARFNAFLQRLGPKRGEWQQAVCAAIAKDQKEK